MNVIPWNPRNQDRRNQKRKHSGLRNKGINKDNDAADLGTQIANKNDKQLCIKRPFTKQNMESEMAMDLCIDEKDEERESEAQSAVRAKKRAPPPPPTRHRTYV